MLAARFAVGHVYEIMTSLDGSKFNLGTKTWVCVHPDSQLVDTWQAKEKARRLTEEAAALERREATNTSHLEKYTKALRLARARLAPSQRTAFDVWLLNEVR